MAARRTGSILDNNAMVSEPRERRHTSITYIVFSLFVTLLGLGVAVAGGLLYGQRQLEAAGPLTVQKTAVVKSGQGGAEIAATLAREGIISNRRIFHIASAIYHRLGRTLKAGEYRFKLKLRSTAAQRDVVLALKPSLLDEHGFYEIATVNVSG